MRDDDSQVDDGTSLREGDETGAWEHPAVEEGEDEAGEPKVDLDSGQVSTEKLTEDEERDFEAMSEQPQLPNALFEAEIDATSIVHWHVDTELDVVQMANEVLTGNEYLHVAATTLVENADGEYRWEIPVEIVEDTGIAPEVDAELPETATFSTGESILFRASDAMLSGETRTCYALTPAALDRLLASRE
jgi:hypothetical protein